MKVRLDIYWYLGLFECVIVGGDGEGNIEPRIPREPLAGACGVAADLRVVLLQDVGQRQELAPRAISAWNRDRTW